MADRGGPPHLFRKDLVTGSKSNSFRQDACSSPMMCRPTGKHARVRSALHARQLRHPHAAAALMGPPLVLMGSPFDESPAAVCAGRAGGRVPLRRDRTLRVVRRGIARNDAQAPSVRRRSARSSVGRSPTRAALLVQRRRAHRRPGRTTPSLQLGSPTTLFVVPQDRAWTDFAVSADGQKFLAVVSDSRGAEQPLTVVLKGLPAARQR